MAGCCLHPPAAPELPALQLSSLPCEILWKILSLILQGSQSFAAVGASCHSLLEAASDPRSWERAAVRAHPEDVEARGGRPAIIEVLAKKWGRCAHIDADLRGRGPETRAAAARCLRILSSTCVELRSLVLRNFLTMESTGFPFLVRNFPSLRFLELRGCEQLSSYDLFLPVFKRHPQLASLQAHFHPRASVSMAFARLAPLSLVSVSFLTFDSPAVVLKLLERCALEHFWMAEGGAYFPAVAEAVSSEWLKTVSVPSRWTDDVCLQIARQCPRVELLCRMRIGSPPFGSGLLADEFEALPGCPTVIRRRGSCMQLAANNCLWSFH